MAMIIGYDNWLLIATYIKFQCDLYSICIFIMAVMAGGIEKDLEGLTENFDDVKLKFELETKVIEDRFLETISKIAGSITQNFVGQDSEYSYLQKLDLKVRVSSLKQCLYILNKSKSILHITFYNLYS